jgi:hypothetical protein
MYMAVASAPPPSANTTASIANGMSGYVPDSTRERLMTFYPPPYGFAAALPSAGMSGHDCGCGGTCGGCGHGMGQDDSPSTLFASGTDISGWGWPEWLIVGLGAFAVASAVSNVASAGRSVGRSVSGYKRRAKKRASLKQQLSEL